MVNNGYWTVHGDIGKGTAVTHNRFGEGFIVDVDGMSFSVAFPVLDDTKEFNCWDVEGEFVPGSIVKHIRYGRGVVIAIEGDKAIIDFSETGIRKELNYTYSFAARRLPEEYLNERDWWKGNVAHPIADFVARLRTVPDEHVGAALDRFLELFLQTPVSDPYIHNQAIYDFFLRAHSRLIRVDRPTGPIVIAHVARLVANDEYERARELLERLPDPDPSELGAVVDYLRFVCHGRVDLAGTTSHSTLSAADVFLAACYYPTSSERKDQKPPACAALKRQTQWDYESLSSSLSEAGNDRALNDFRVCGLQPRIAELAFRNVYGFLHGAKAQNRLHDLNLACVRGLATPWTLESRPTLPGADWEDGNRQGYDVKCNLFYRNRSTQQRVGLRGFILEGIGRSKIENHYFPGFVFTRTDNESCTWVYVGEYRPITRIEQTGDRVLPFCFRMPDRARYVRSFPVRDHAVCIDVLKDGLLRIGWQLAIGMSDAPKQERTIGESLLDSFVERCLAITLDTFLEYALWEALTETTLDACWRYHRESLRSFLELANKLISSPFLPIRLPRIGETPILSRWITDVLHPLSDNWSDIQCGRCQCVASEPGIIRLGNLRMTSEGTVKGQVSCTKCGYVKDRVTLLTHCHKCGHYPLMIGKNRVCGCGGLVCEWRGEGQAVPCGSCKKGCERAKSRLALQTNQS